MGEQQPMTQIMKVTEARAQFSQLLNQVFRHERRVLVEKDGIPVAAIVSTDDLRQLQRLEADCSQRFAALNRFADAFRDEPSEVIEQEAVKAVAAARAERQAAHDLAVDARAGESRRHASPARRICCSWTMTARISSVPFARSW